MNTELKNYLRFIPALVIVAVLAATFAVLATRGESTKSNVDLTSEVVESTTTTVDESTTTTTTAVEAPESPESAPVAPTTVAPRYEAPEAPVAAPEPSYEEPAPVVTTTTTAALPGTTTTTMKREPVTDEWCREHGYDRANASHTGCLGF